MARIFKRMTPLGGPLTGAHRPNADKIRLIQKDIESVRRFAPKAVVGRRINQPLLRNAVTVELLAVQGRREPITSAALKKNHPLLLSAGCIAYGNWEGMIRVILPKADSVKIKRDYTERKNWLRDSILWHCKQNKPIPEVIYNEALLYFDDFTELVVSAGLNPTQLQIAKEPINPSERPQNS